MALVSGALLAVDGLPSVARWEVEWDRRTIDVVTSGTKEALVRACGAADWQATIECLGWPDKTPGEEFTFKGSIDGTNGATGDCYLEEIQVVADYENNAPLMTTYRAVSNGALTFGAAAATDAAAPDVICPATIAVTGFTGDVAAWIFVARRTGIPYVSSETDGVRKRVKGAWNISAIVDLYLGSGVPTLDASTSLTFGGTGGITFNGAYAHRVQEFGADSSIIVNGRELKRFRVTFDHDARDSGNTVKVAGTTLWPSA